MGANGDRAPRRTPAGNHAHAPQKVSKPPSIPIILVLGPPGSGKGTICKQLAADFNLHHLSVGDWLRAQAAPPIADVPDHINDFVFRGVAVPDAVLEAEYGDVEAEYGDVEDAPAPLTLYNCSKRNISTPETMKCKLMPALKAEIEALAMPACGGGSWRWRDRPKAVLLDNLTSTLAHAEAAAATFGEDFPTMAIAVDCSDGTAEARFLARGRGGDDVARFKRRIARYRGGSREVVSFFREGGTEITEVSTEGKSEAVYEKLLAALDESEVWRAIVVEKARGGSSLGFEQPSSASWRQVGVGA